MEPNKTFDSNLKEDKDFLFKLLAVFSKQNDLSEKSLRFIEIRKSDINKKLLISIISLTSLTLVISIKYLIDVYGFSEKSLIYGIALIIVKIATTLALFSFKDAYINHHVNTVLIPTMRDPCSGIKFKTLETEKYFHLEIFLKDDQGSPLHFRVCNFRTIYAMADFNRDILNNLKALPEYAKASQYFN